MGLLGAGLTLFGASRQARDQRRSSRENAERALARGKEQNIYNQVAATQAEAVGQVGAFEETRQAELVASRAIAVAAAGGYTPDIDVLLADIYGEGAYRASLVLHEAETRAEALRFEGKQAEQYGIDSAAESISAGRDAANATRTNAIASIFSFF